MAIRRPSPLPYISSLSIVPGEGYQAGGIVERKLKTPIRPQIRIQEKRKIICAQLPDAYLTCNHRAYRKEVEKDDPQHVLQVLVELGLYIIHLPEAEM